MKYLETIKSITLVLLIALSLVFTFLILNSAPYDTIGKRSPIDISIAEFPENKDIASLIKPYKIHFNFEEGLTGTTDSDQIDYMVNHLKRWRLSNPQLVDQNFSKEKLNQYMRGVNHATFYYADGIPLPVYNSVLNIESPNIPETNFDLLLLDWDLNTATLDVHFINQENELHYKSTAEIPETQAFIREVINVGHSYDEYVEVLPEGNKFIVVPNEEVQLVKNTYFPNERDKINPTRFRSALFSDPNAVRRSPAGPNREDFQDNHALMTVDSEKKQMQFVHPVVQSKELAIPSDLLEDTIDFVNSHGGWTDEYRFSSMNFRTRYVSFKLYVRGVPVLSGNTSTEIEQVWGEEAIYQYKRPYYTLGDTLPSEMETVTLPSGKSIAEALMKSEEINFSAIEEIIPAYYMEQDVDLNIFVLEPSWYYKRNGNWARFSTEQLGGKKNGLE